MEVSGVAAAEVEATAVLSSRYYAKQKNNQIITNSASRNKKLSLSIWLRSTTTISASSCRKSARAPPSRFCLQFPTFCWTRPKVGPRTALKVLFVIPNILLNSMSFCRKSVCAPPWRFCLQFPHCDLEPEIIKGNVQCPPLSVQVAYGWKYSLVNFKRDLTWRIREIAIFVHTYLFGRRENSIVATCLNGPIQNGRWVWAERPFVHVVPARVSHVSEPHDGYTSLRFLEMVSFFR